MTSDQPPHPLKHRSRAMATKRDEVRDRIAGMTNAAWRPRVAKT